MKLVSTEMDFNELKSLAEEFAEKIGIRLHNIENRSENRTISRGKHKGKKRHVCFFHLRPIEGCDRYRKCKNIGSRDEPRYTRQAYACWVAYIQFGALLLNWWREDDNWNKDIEMYAGGRRYNSRGSLIDYVDLGWQEYYDSNASPSKINSLNGRVGQQQMCMCNHGLIEGQKERCDEL